MFEIMRRFCSRCSYRADSCFLGEPSRRLPAPQLVNGCAQVPPLFRLFFLLVFFCRRLNAAYSRSRQTLRWQPTTQRFRKGRARSSMQVRLFPNDKPRCRTIEPSNLRRTRHRLKTAQVPRLLLHRRMNRRASTRRPSSKSNNRRSSGCWASFPPSIRLIKTMLFP